MGNPAPDDGPLSPADRAELDQNVAGCADTMVELAAVVLRRHAGDPINAGVKLSEWLLQNVSHDELAAAHAALAVRVACAPKENTYG